MHVSCSALRTTLSSSNKREYMCSAMKLLIIRPTPKGVHVRMPQALRGAVVSLRFESSYPHLPLLVQQVWGPAVRTNASGCFEEAAAKCHAVLSFKVRGRPQTGPLLRWGVVLQAPYCEALHFWTVCSHDGSRSAVRTFNGSLPKACRADAWHLKSARRHSASAGAPRNRNRSPRHKVDLVGGDVIGVASGKRRKHRTAAGSSGKPPSPSADWRGAPTGHAALHPRDDATMSEGEAAGDGDAPAAAQHVGGVMEAEGRGRVGGDGSFSEQMDAVTKATEEVGGEDVGEEVQALYACLHAYVRG